MAFRPLLRRTTINKGLGSTWLVVLAHGLQRKPMEQCEAAIRAGFPEADILAPVYTSGPLSNVSPTELARHFAERIEMAYEDHRRENQGVPYASIVLVGHDAGGLILRKAYLDAVGIGPHGELRQDITPMAWVKALDRLVLLASLNRGIVIGRSENSSLVTYLLKRLGLAILPLLNLVGMAHYVAELRQGSRFVSNLRIRWIRASQSTQIELAPMIQILGACDGVVRARDNLDVIVDARFKFLRLIETDHLSILNFREPAEGLGAYRWRKLHYALTQPIDAFDGDDIAGEDLSILNQVDPGTDRVVFIMHGIRDISHWPNLIADEVEAMGASLGKAIKTITASYGYFNLIKFLFFVDRQKNVRWFMDQYTQAVARYPNAAIDYIGHSNGTYLLGSALQRYSSVKVNRVALAGSVLRTSYPWDERISEGRVEEIRSDTASADLIVGLFPGLYEKLGLSDLGSAGHNGFTDNAPRRSSFHRYFKGGHGAAIVRGNHRSLAAFILKAEKVEPESGLLVEEQSNLAVLLSKFNYLVWIALLLIVVALGVGIVALLTLHPVLALHPWLAWVLYGLGLLVVLSSF